VVLDTVMMEIDLVTDEETGGQVLRLAAQHLCPEHTSTIGLYLGD
jgi:hypothetical protein